jgi:two-component system OmpR family response regulator
MKILVVEDERKIADLVRKALETSGFIVETCTNGDDALAWASRSAFDALVLDIMIPGRDGLSVLRHLRAAGNSTPILLLTARSSPDERVEGLNLGADDYLPKPFYTEELVARLKAIIRRRDPAHSSRLESGNLSVDLVSREVRVAGQPVELTTREFALLTCLMRSPQRVFTRPQLCERVWNYHHDPGTNLVDVYIQRLRRKLGDDPLRPRIETLRGVGYRFVEAQPPSAP